MGAENLHPTGIRSPDRPTRCESLYRLSYPGSHICLVPRLRISGVIPPLLHTPAQPVQRQPRSWPTPYVFCELTGRQSTATLVRKHRTTQFVHTVHRPVNVVRLSLSSSETPSSYCNPCFRFHLSPQYLSCPRHRTRQQSVLSIYRMYISKFYSLHRHRDWLSLEKIHSTKWN